MSDCCEPSNIPLPVLGRKIFIGAYPVLYIQINEQNEVGLPLNIILTACLYPAPQETLNCSSLVGNKINLYLGRLTGRILPKGCLGSGVFLSVFDAPGDLRPSSMFCELPNVFFSQNSVHLATLTLTPSFIRSPSWFSDCMFSLPQQGLEKLLLKTDLKLQGVLRLCFPEILT